MTGSDPSGKFPKDFGYKKVDDPAAGFRYVKMESDPNGKSLKESGAKGDYGKIPVVRGAIHYFPRAITAIAHLSFLGARKYSWKGWEKVPDGIHRYGDAMGRHELNIEDDFFKTVPDLPEPVLEVVAVAWNAMARAELVLRELEKNKTK